VATLVEHLMNDDAFEPRAEAVGLAQLTDALEGADESGLDRVPGACLAATQAHGQGPGGRRKASIRSFLRLAAVFFQRGQVCWIDRRRKIHHVAKTLVDGKRSQAIAGLLAGAPGKWRSVDRLALE